jgi:hypothetical protein
MAAIASLPVPGDSRRRPDPTKRSHSPARQRLVMMAQGQVFGTIHDLLFRNGDPVFDPPPKVIRRVKLGGHNTARPQAAAADFVLKQEWVELFNHLDACENGTVLVIEVAHGLPLFFEIEQPVSN